jgi:hypothetical protein
MLVMMGRRPYGKVDVCGQSFVYTEFAHINAIPLVPLRSYAVCVQDAEHAELVPIPLHRRSVVAGYARTWSIVGLGASLLSAGLLPDGTGALALSAVLAVVCVLSNVAFGKIGPHERAQRLGKIGAGGG